MAQLPNCLKTNKNGVLSLLFRSKDALCIDNFPLQSESADATNATPKLLLFHVSGIQKAILQIPEPNGGILGFHGSHSKLSHDILCRDDARSSALRRPWLLDDRMHSNNDCYWHVGCLETLD